MQSQKQNKPSPKRRKGDKKGDNAMDGFTVKNKDLKMLSYLICCGYDLIASRDEWDSWDRKALKKAKRWVFALNGIELK